MVFASIGNGFEPTFLPRIWKVLDDERIRESTPADPEFINKSELMVYDVHRPRQPILANAFDY